MKINIKLSEKLTLFITKKNVQLLNSAYGKLTAQRDYISFLQKYTNIC